MTSTTSNVEQMHRHTGITIVMTSWTAYMVLAKLLCAWWFPQVLVKLVVQPTTASSNICKTPPMVPLKVQNVINCCSAYIFTIFLRLRRSRLHDTSILHHYFVS
jgi:hypothetical protein